jgi:hypothetical protein
LPLLQYGCYNFKLKFKLELALSAISEYGYSGASFNRTLKSAILNLATGAQTSKIV